MIFDYPYTDMHELNLDWFLAKFKDLVETWNNVESEWNSLHDYVQNYFENLNVQTEINDKINAMILDGTFADIISPFVTAALPALVAGQLPDVVAAQISSVVAAQISAVVADQLPAVAAAAAAAEVGDWLSAHIDPDTGYVIDDTLTVSQAAADAKSTGDAINNINDIIDLISKIKPGSNLFDKNKAVSNKYIATNGTITSLNGTAYSDLIPVENGKIYCYDSSSQYGANRGKCFLYDSDGVFISAESANAITSSIYSYKITNVSVKYIRVNLMATMLDSMMVLEGINYPTSANYLPYSLKSYLQGNFLDVFDRYTSENLFNKDSGCNRIDRYIQSDGSINNVPGSGYMYSHFIPVEAGETYVYAVSADYGANKNQAFIYDEVGAYLERIDGTLTTNINSITINNVNAKYVRINLTTSNKGNLMFIKGNEYPTDYIAYADDYKLKDGVHISNEQYTNLLSLIAQAAGQTSGNPLQGKKIALEGDSICYGYGYLGGYGKIIADRNEMLYYNGAVSGSKIVGDIKGRISSMPNDADYYIIEGGVNDYAAGNYTLGTVQNWGYSIDETTVTGAVQWIFRYLYNHFPGKKYGFVFPHRIQQYGSAWDTTFKPAMKEALTKWGIPYIDIEELGMPLNMVQEYKDAYTDNGDGWHPNEQGYKKIYCDKIEAWLKTL